MGIMIPWVDTQFGFWKPKIIIPLAGGGVAPDEVAAAANLTVWLDASDIASGWTPDPPVDDALVQAWPSKGVPGESFQQSIETNRPSYQTDQDPSPSVDFDGVDNFLQPPGGAVDVLSEIVSAGAYTILAVVAIDAIGTDSDTAYANEAIISDSSNFLGMHLRSTPSFVAYHWDGGEKKVTLGISLGTPTLLMMRADGTNLYASVDGGPETSVAAGNISTLTGTNFIGKMASSYINGRLKHLCIYNADLASSGTDLPDVIAWLKDDEGIA